LTDNSAYTYVQLDVHQLGVRRGGVMVISNLSFTVKAQAALMVSGPNGVGKTSLLRALSGLLECETGVAKLGQENLATNMLHYVGHGEGLKGQLTITENLNFMFDLLGEPDEERPNIDGLLSKIGLLQQRNQMASDLSAGQKRRAAMARLFMVPRQVWLLDEPFTALDLGGRVWLSEAVRAHCQAGGIVVAASHEPLDFATQYLTLEAGV